MLTRWNLALCVLLSACLGCGYNLVGLGSNIPDDIDLVFLSPLDNETTRSEVEQILTQAIADELVTRRRFDLAPQRRGSHAVLEGVVTEFRVTPVSFDRDGRADEYEITIVADMSFRRTESEEVLWEAGRYAFRENYEVDTDASSFVDRENFAIEETSIRFAETMVSDLLEGF